MTTNYEFYYEQLTLLEQEVYRQIVAALSSRQMNLKITPLLTEQSLHAIFSAVNYDHPELWYVDFTRIQLLQLGPIREVTFYQPSGSCCRKASINLEGRAEEVCNAILENAPRSQYELCQRLHDYLVQHVEYDDAALNDHFSESHTAVGSLINQKAVCEGYAKAFKLMCDYAGIKSIVVTGRSMFPGETSNGLHAWNAVHLTGQWTYVDITWDCKMSEASKVVRYDYFLESANVFQRDHQMFGDFQLKADGRAVDYFTSAHALVTGRDELEAHLSSCDRRGSQTYYFRVNDEYKNRNDLTSRIDAVVVSHLRRTCPCGFEYETAHNQAQQIFFYTYKKLGLAS